MENIFITLTGQNHYYGMRPFKINSIVRLEKDKDNEHDGEAVRAMLPFIDTVAYVANSTNTVYAGTSSAGRIYGVMGDTAYAQVMFVTHSSVIAILIPPDAVKMGNDGYTLTIGADDTDTDSKITAQDGVKMKIGF